MRSLPMMKAFDPEADHTPIVPKPVRLLCSLGGKTFSRMQSEAMAHFLIFFLPTDQEGDRHQCGETGEGPSAGTPDVEHVQHVLTQLMFQFVV